MTDSVRANPQAAFRTRAGRLLFFALLGLALPVSAEIYKWTDSQGKAHYSDQPPTVDAQTIDSPASGRATEESMQSLQAGEQAFQKRRSDAEAARVKTEEAARQARAKRENCEKARSNLGTLQNSARVYTSGAGGQRSYMNEATRAEALARTRKAIADNCP